MSTGVDDGSPKPKKPVKNKPQFELIQRLQYLDRKAGGLANQIIQVNVERQKLLAGCIHLWADGGSTLDDGFALSAKHQAHQLSSKRHNTPSRRQCHDPEQQSLVGSQ